jgi:hypothetical protein
MARSLLLSEAQVHYFLYEAPATFLVGLRALVIARSVRTAVPTQNAREAPPFSSENTTRYRALSSEVFTSTNTLMMALLSLPRSGGGMHHGLPRLNPLAHRRMLALANGSYDRSGAFWLSANAATSILE